MSHSISFLIFMADSITRRMRRPWARSRRVESREINVPESSAALNALNRSKIVQLKKENRHAPLRSRRNGRASIPDA